MTEHEKVFSIINPIIWDKGNEPFSLEMINKALEEAGAIKRTSPCITIKDYLKSLRDFGVLVYIGEGLYQKDTEFIDRYMSS